MDVAGADLDLEKVNKLIRTHKCTSCGSCCRNFAYIRLPQEDIKALETITGLMVEEFTNKVDEAGDKRFLKFKKNGDCIFLAMIDGAYSCSVYKARPLTCRSYPYTDIQKETCHLNHDRL